MKRFIFPVVNAVIVTMLFGLVGYYAGNPGLWVVIGLVGGLLVGLAAEFGLGLIGGWWYRRRVTLVALMQIPLIIFFIGPYGFVLGLSQPANTTICCVSPADFGADYRAVSIPGADGVTLAGWYVPPTAPHGAVIILLHGGGGNRTGMMWQAARLYTAGYGLLMYDQRALGESTGTTQSFGWLDARDIPPVIDFLVEQPEVNPDRIGGLGLSLGAQILILAGPDEPRLKAFFLEGVNAARASDFPEAKNVGEQFALLLNVQIERANQFHLGIAPPPGFVEQIPKLAPRPVLMVVGALDDFENRINQHYAALLGENAEQWVIENAHHGGGPNVVPELYTARMLDFFEQALLQ
ncbi:MAG: alpha/beta fold hydrolase [Anaerolineae bacterium]|nr:alpha/beta fold hydrolase [Anaerolineae bacterium]